MSVVWECGSCGTRSLERRCEECNLFCSKVGTGAGVPGVFGADFRRRAGGQCGERGW